MAWGFGLHEALDQFGALFGPLVVAAVLASRGNYRTAFAVLLVPAIVTLTLLVIARFLYPRPRRHGGQCSKYRGSRIAPHLSGFISLEQLLSRLDSRIFSLIAYHFQKASAIQPRGYRSFIPWQWQ